VFSVRPLGQFREAVASVLDGHRHGDAVGFQPDVRRTVGVLQNVLHQGRDDDIGNGDQVAQ
jgi:hypothetical protein